MKRKYLYSTLLLILLGYQLMAQMLHTRDFQIDAANPMYRFTALIHASNGYIYAGTTHGLYRFDGESFEKTEWANRLITDSVTSLMEDHSHTIWAGFQNGVLARIVKGKLEEVQMEEGHPAKPVTCLLQDKQNQIWFGTNGEGIYVIRNNRQFLVNEENGLNDGHIHAICVTDDGDILATTDQGISICRTSGKSIHVKNYGPQQGLPDYLATSICPAGNNRYWIGFQDKGVCLFDHNTEHCSIPLFSRNWNYGKVNDISITRQFLWIATSDFGLLKYRLGQQESGTIDRSAKSDNPVEFLLQDAEGNLWFTSDHKTLVHSFGETLEMIPAIDQTLFPQVHAVAIDAGNNLWLNETRAILQFQHNDAGLQTIRYPMPPLDPKTEISSLFCDSLNHVWIGTMGEGLFLLDKSTRKISHLGPEKGFQINNVLSIRGNQDAIFVSGFEGVSMISLNASDRTANNPGYTIQQFNNAEQLGSQYIYSTYKDTRGALWFATDGKGIACFDHGTWTQYHQQIKDRHVFSITEGNDGSIWFSTGSSGIYRFDGKRFKNYGIHEGLSSLDISSIGCDREGNVLIFHPNEIDVLQPQTGHIAYLGKNQGLEQLGIGLNMATAGADGSIYFLSANGIGHFNPMARMQQHPVTQISAVEVQGSWIDPLQNGFFRFDDNYINFRFKGVFLSDPAHVYYQYKLEGLDSNWVNTRDLSKSFPSLQPGNYRFRVRCALNENFSGATEASYSFTIDKPYWKKTWFIILTILLIGAALALYIRFRERNLQHLERLQNEKMKFEFEVLRNQVNPHFLFNSFNTLISIIEEAPKEAVSYVEHLSDYFRNIVNYRDKNIIPLEEELLLMADYWFLQQKRYGSNLVMNNQVQAAQAHACYIPPLALQLLLENAIKHNAISKETPLTIQLYINEQDQLVVSNNLNKKITPSSGAGMGLENIANRYRLLTHKPVEIKETEHSFAVYLPLIHQ